MRKILYNYCFFQPNRQPMENIPPVNLFHDQNDHRPPKQTKKKTRKKLFKFHRAVILEIATMFSWKLTAEQEGLSFRFYSKFIFGVTKAKSKRNCATKQKIKNIPNSFLAVKGIFFCCRAIVCQNLINLIKLEKFSEGR